MSSGFVLCKAKCPGSPEISGRTGAFEFAKLRCQLMVSGMVVNCSAADTPLLVCAQMVRV